MWDGCTESAMKYKLCTEDVLKLGVLYEQS
jgi:hypothetical protein